MSNEMCGDIPSSFPSCSNHVSSSVSSPASFTGLKKSLVHSAQSNLPCLMLIALILVIISRIEPQTKPTASLYELVRETGLKINEFLTPLLALTW